MRQIIYAWNYREWGGVQIYFLSLIKEVRTRFEVVVVLPDNSEARVMDTLRDLGVKMMFSPAAPPLKRGLGLVERFRARINVFSAERNFIKTVIGEIRDRETIVHADLGFWQSAFSIVRLCRKAHVFITVHTPLEQQGFLREMAWRWKGFAVSLEPNMHFLTSNGDARRSLAGYLRGRVYDEIVVTYAGFDPAEMEAVASIYPGREALLRKYGLRDRPLVVTVGRFIERKGCWVVLRALKELIERGTELTFLWLTTTPVSPEIQTRIDEYGLGDRLKLISSDDMGGERSEMLSLVLASDIFVLASLQEGLPIALVEAMALGRACIATNVNAIPEAVENGVSGVLIEKKDEVALSGEVQRLLGDEKLRKKLGSAARAIALERFNEMATAETTLKLYDAVWKSGQ